MNIVLWILQILLAVAFLGHSWLMLFPSAEMVELMNASMPPWLRIFIGIVEVLGAIGLILPGLTRIQPQLTAWAVTGLATIVALATLLHLIRAEYSSAGTTAVLFVVAAFVAYMRWRVKPIAARQNQQVVDRTAY